jgi:plasmid replication initiation protein
MKKDLVVKDNALINASYNLDLVEQRLILLAIIEARQNGTSTNKVLTVYADSYVNQFDVHRNTAYQALRDACENLFERRFSYQVLSPKGNLEQVKSRWVQRISYVENEALVRLQFSDDVVPLITNLEKHFTSYELEQVSQLNSAYAVRLYELLIAWRGSCKTPIYEMSEFRNRLGVEASEYKLMHQFKSRVLDLAIEQINEHTDITVKYDQHKAGRVITGFSFTFGFKKSAKPKSTRAQAVEPPPTSDPAAEKREAYGLFLSYQRQSKALNQALETLATNSEMKLFKKLGFMK